MSDGDEFDELLWENGQAMVHGRTRRKHPHPQAAFPPFGYGGTSSSRGREKQPSGDTAAVFTKTVGVFGAVGMAPSVHDFAPGLDATHDNGDDDTVPWIHYPIIDDDDNTAPALAADYCSDFFSELQAAAANLGSLPPSNHNATSIRSTPVATSSREPSKKSHGLSVPAARTSEPQAELDAAKQPRPSGSREGVMNFSLFSRPAALARASLQSAQRQQGTDKASNATASNRMESTVVQTASGPRNAPVLADQRTVWPQPKEVRFASTAAPTATGGNLQQEMPRDKVGNNMAVPVKTDEARKAREATVATSSVCSGNGARNDESYRKIGSLQDLDDESGVLRRSATRSAKRSRIAEVHNLSERMMSMGTGLCIPPMLLPPAMQHLQIPPMALFPHLGMGLGYGMGVFDMNSTGRIPIPPMPGAHFPCPMIPGATPQGLGIPGPNALPMFGVPGQANPSSASSVPPFASLAGLPVRPNLAPQDSGSMANMVQEQQGITNQQQESLRKEARQGENTGDPQIQIITQGENQHFRAPSSAQTKSRQFLDGSGKETNTTGRNGAEA